MLRLPAKECHRGLQNQGIQKSDPTANTSKESDLTKKKKRSMCVVLTKDGGGERGKGTEHLVYLKTGELK